MFRDQSNKLRTRHYRWRIQVSHSRATSTELSDARGGPFRRRSLPLPPSQAHRAERPTTYSPLVLAGSFNEMRLSKMSLGAVAMVLLGALQLPVVVAQGELGQRNGDPLRPRWVSLLITSCSERFQVADQRCSHTGLACPAIAQTFPGTALQLQAPRPTRRRKPCE